MPMKHYFSQVIHSHLLTVWFLPFIIFFFLYEFYNPLRSNILLAVNEQPSCVWSPYSCFYNWRGNFQGLYSILGKNLYLVLISWNLTLLGFHQQQMCGLYSFLGLCSNTRATPDSSAASFSPTVPQAL